jgi:hypothetical protein
METYPTPLGLASIILPSNASRHKAMSYQRVVTEEPKLAAEVKAWLDQAEVADQAKDAQHGRERRGDEMPEWVANKQRRLERIRQAKAQLERSGQSRSGWLWPLLGHAGAGCT